MNKEDKYKLVRPNGQIIQRAKRKHVLREHKPKYEKIYLEKLKIEEIKNA